jgi:hypothetical protein
MPYETPFERQIPEKLTDIAIRKIQSYPNIRTKTRRYTLRARKPLREEITHGRPDHSTPSRSRNPIHLDTVAGREPLK